MNAAAVSHADGARRESGVHAAEVVRLRRGDGEGAVQGELLELSRRDDASCAISFCRINHSLEQWGDAEPVRGTLSLQQPAMDPVFDTRATRMCSSRVAKGRSRRPPRATRSRLSQLADLPLPGGRAGVRRRAAARHGGRHARRDALTPRAGSASAHRRSDGAVERQLVPRRLSASVSRRRARRQQAVAAGDSRSGHKIAWQTVAEMHPATATELGVENGDHVNVQTAAGKLTLPVLRLSRRSARHGGDRDRARTRRLPADTRSAGRQSARAAAGRGRSGRWRRVRVDQGERHEDGWIRRTSSRPKARRGSTDAASVRRSRSLISSWPPARHGHRHAARRTDGAGEPEEHRRRRQARIPAGTALAGRERRAGRVRRPRSRRRRACTIRSTGAGWRSAAGR